MKQMIAIVGRPNVGKSTLFNRLTKTRNAIVHNMPGVTIDRNYGEVDWYGKSFTIVDTGGFEPVTADKILVQMREQAQLAIEEAEAIIFLMDGKEGLTSVDIAVADILRKTQKRVYYVVNKIDGEKAEDAIYDFYRLGVENIYTIAAEHNRGVTDLIDDVASKLPVDDQEEEEGITKLAIIGRPNVGKSSIVNRILGSERLIVSEIPGTTRDSIDTLFESDEQKYLLIDTAGIRRKSKVSDRLEKYTILKALGSIDRCDVAIIVIDAVEGVTEQDVKVAGYAHEKGKGCIIAVNKWDLIEKDNMTVGKYVDKIKISLKYMDYACIVFISALTGQRTMKIISLAKEIVEQRNKRAPTGELNRVVKTATLRHHPPACGGRFVKIYYSSQFLVSPPTFAIFTNYPNDIHFSYERYLENKIREAFGYQGTPIKLKFKARTGRKKLFKK